MAGWVTAAAAVVGGISAYQQSKSQEKIAKMAAKGSTTTRTPYMAERINPVIPYIMSDAQRIYENRMKTYGLPAGDFSPIAQQLAGIPADYNGVGNQHFAGPAPYGSNRLPERLGGGFANVNVMEGSPELDAMIEQRRAARQAWQEERGGGMGGAVPGGVGKNMDMSDLINYWGMDS